MTSGLTVGRERAGTDGRDKEDGDRAKEGGERQRKRGRATGRLLGGDTSLTPRDAVDDDDVANFNASKTTPASRSSAEKTDRPTDHRPGGRGGRGRVLIAYWLVARRFPLSFYNAGARSLARVFLFFFLTRATNRRAGHTESVVIGDD